MARMRDSDEMIERKVETELSNIVRKCFVVNTKSTISGRYSFLVQNLTERAFTARIRHCYSLLRH